MSYVLVVLLYGLKHSESCPIQMKFVILLTTVKYWEPLIFLYRITFTGDGNFPGELVVTLPIREHESMDTFAFNTLLKISLIWVLSDDSDWSELLLYSLLKMIILFARIWLSIKQPVLVIIFFNRSNGMVIIFGYR